MYLVLKRNLNFAEHYIQLLSHLILKIDPNKGIGIVFILQMKKFNPIEIKRFFPTLLARIGS